MFKPGAILKIIVKDFVTYSYVEVIPGPHLNLIIGPNGTGKSTIVAAIILGLGGNPKTVGRGTKISEYVKNKCEEATIELHLQDKKPDKLVKIKRKFDKHDKTVWFLHDKQVTSKEIKSVIKEFNIQVDNLCQFLPQDRVQDFSKMNKQELLKQTQVAICRQDLVENQEKLIQMREEQKRLESSAEQSTHKLQELIDANLRVEGKVQNLKKRDRYTKCVKDIDRKIAWVTYEDKRAKVDDSKADVKMASEALHKHEQAAGPIEKALSNAKKVSTSIQKNIDIKQQEIKKKELKLQQQLSVQNELKGEIKQILVEKGSRIQEVENKEREISSISEGINTLNRRKAEILTTFGDEFQRKLKITALDNNLKNTSSILNNYTNKNDTLESSKRNKVHELRALQNDLDKLENVREQRLQWLHRKDKDAYNAVMWLRNNRHLFQGDVFEPMVLELNVHDPKHSSYIENIIPFRDKLAFTCTLKEDMNLLIRALMDQQQLRVNILHAGSDNQKFHSFRPKLPIEQLMQYGFFAYAHSLFTGPEPIMRYLCKNYHIHNIPVGNHTTNRYYQEVPPQITHFYSDQFQFVTSYSKYSREKSTRQNQINSDGSLTVSVDTERMELIKGQIDEVKQACQRYNLQIDAINVEIGQLREQQVATSNNLNEMRRSVQLLVNIERDIRIAKEKLDNTKRNDITVEQIKKETDRALQNATKNMQKHQHKILAAFKIYAQHMSQIQLDKSNIKLTQKQVSFLENKCKDIRKLILKAEETVHIVSRAYESMKAEAKVALATAKQLSQGFVPTDRGFQVFQEAYDSLSDDIQELETEKQDILTKIECLSTADETELREYETRKNTIDKIQNGMKNSESQLAQINADITKCKQEWLEPLQELVKEINHKFASAFERIHCAGEVSICTGEDENEYSEYGLGVKVKYRHNQPLQELNNIVQSGGERAVATAAFMLSLQELTPVPFRCVDEINQGMDPNNERRMFELLVDTISESEISQYFFITPKLVSNLRYIPFTKVHVVCNGSYIPKNKDWDDIINTKYLRVCK